MISSSMMAVNALKSWISLGAVDPLPPGGAVADPVPSHHLVGRVARVRPLLLRALVQELPVLGLPSVARGLDLLLDEFHDPVGDAVLQVLRGDLEVEDHPAILAPHIPDEGDARDG